MGEAAEAPYVAGDADCDDSVTFLDINHFLQALNGYRAWYDYHVTQTGYPPTCSYLNSDANGDGYVDFSDISAFTGLLGTGGMSAQAAYEWDCENRLIEVRPLVPEAGAQKVNFTYDCMGRRVAKRVYDWDDVSHEWETTPAAVHKFVWDGWLMLMELEQTGSPPADTIARKYTWGLDLAGLSGSVGPVSNRSILESAGGIGGLLALDQAAIDRLGEQPDIPAGQYVYFCDANGNVGQVVRIVTPPAWMSVRLKAHYEYDPYGNVIATSSAYVEENPWWFSTKYWDDETGLGYWGYRYRSPSPGRWLSRDPIGEGGGENLSSYCSNHPMGTCDSDGGREFGGGVGGWIREPRE